MAKLTEDMVVARTRASDLSAIKKLNCWGGELQDISLLRRMNNVEVLSLRFFQAVYLPTNYQVSKEEGPSSGVLKNVCNGNWPNEILKVPKTLYRRLLKRKYVNKISSLVDVQYCKNLRELYVRKNEIQNLNEICYLKNLPYLKALWLGENPCSVSDSLYRLTVIKNLPSLEKLDDVKIEPEERQDSLKKGRDLVHPEDYDYDNSSPAQSPVRASRSPPASGRSSDQDFEDSNESRKSYSPDYEQQTYTSSDRYGQGNDRYDSRNYKSGRRPSEASYDQNYDNGEVSESLTLEKQKDPQNSSYLNRCNSDTSIILKKDKSLSDSNMKVTHNATNQDDSEGDCIIESKEGYCNCSMQHHDRRSQINASRCRDRGEATRCSSSEGSGRTSPQKGERTHRQYDNYRIEGDRYSKGSPYPPRRPVTRNSNLLSAVLCLIKELDYPSLEVVAIAVRCRMDEFDD